MTTALRSISAALLALGVLSPLVGCADDTGDAPLTGGNGAGSSQGGAAATGGGDMGGGAVVGTPQCGGATEMSGTIETALPNLPPLTNLRACVNGDAVGVHFDPLDDAVDYRIYALPADEDISVAGDGSVTIADALYRCAGGRAGLYMLNDDPTTNDNAAGGYTIVNGDVVGFTRSEADSTLGHVYATAADDRLPVYVVGRGEAGLDQGRAVFNSSRPKRYTTDPDQRDQWVSEHGRDDGIAFYVPKDGTAGTHAVYEGPADDVRLRWVDGPEGTMRGSGALLFNVLDAPTTDSLPLKRVFVSPYFLPQHDELVAGEARFRKVRSEGDHPLSELRWSGLTASTVLVIEALDGGCPYQGALSTAHQDAYSEEFGASIFQHETFFTIDELRAASATGEVFVNGQFDDVPLPRAIARSLIQVAPKPPEGFDFHVTFPEDSSFRDAFGAPEGDDYARHFPADDYTFSTYSTSRVQFGSMLGEFWTTYNDIASDTNGKIRLTPKQTGMLSADSYLHVTTEVDVISTDRRYPQILISDQLAPVQDNLEQGTTLVVQPKGFSPTFMQVQVCDHRTWDVNNQCPMLATLSTDFTSPAPLPGERTGADNAVKIDVYVSTERIYVLLDDVPYSCTGLPGKAEDGMVYQLPAGEVSITLGDVLYHSDADFTPGGALIQGNSYRFLREHLFRDARRHFDNFGFSSGSPPPEWDEVLVPCVSPP